MIRALLLLILLAWAPAATGQSLTHTSVIAPEAMLTADDAASGDQFGIAVDADGDRAVVGAYGGQTVYVYQREASGGWTQMASVTAPTLAGGDEYGRAVTISGTCLLIGAPNHQGRGAVFVYVLEDATWQYKAILMPTAESNARFGFALDFDGDRAIMLAETLGQAFIYEYSGGGVFVDDGSVNVGETARGGYGGTVAISGELALIGAPRSNLAGSQAGAVTAVRRNPSTGNWGLDGTITDPSPDPGALFGFSVALDGNTAIIGAAHDDGAGEKSGAASIWTHSDAGWAFGTELPTGDAGQRFGFSVDLDSERALVGSVTDQGLSGGARVFVPSGGTWIDGASLEPGDVESGDQYGISVSLSGATAVVGSVLDDTGGGNAGAAYAFDLTSVVSTIGGPNADLAVTVAPNPASGVATISVEAPLAPEARVEIVDMAGRTVATVPLPAGAARETVVIDTLAPGVYVARLIAGEAIASTRFVIAR